MRHATPPSLIGQTPALRDLMEEISRVADSDAKVLITGESGTGKELVAREIHVRSARASRPFVPVNCAGIPETLLESELFGYIKGSFTGAYRDRPGKLESADQGTIFLDEIGEMTVRMQGLLLRFLETGEVQKVGSDRIEKHVNVRVIAATNRSLSEMVAQGQFREDLFYRSERHSLVRSFAARAPGGHPAARRTFPGVGSTPRSNGNGNGHANVNAYGNGNGERPRERQWSR